MHAMQQFWTYRLYGADGMFSRLVICIADQTQWNGVLGFSRKLAIVDIGA